MYLLCIDCSNQYKVNTYHYINYQDYGCTNQYKVNTYHYINYQDYGCTLNSNYGKTNV